MSELTFRAGRAGDLQAAYELGERAWDESRHERGLIPEEKIKSEADLKEAWPRDRPLIEFLTAQAGGSFMVCEEGDELVGFLDAWDCVRARKTVPLTIETMRGTLPRGGTVLGTKRGSPFDTESGADEVAASIADLGPGGLTVYPGDYDDYLVERQARRELL